MPVKLRNSLLNIGLTYLMVVFASPVFAQDFADQHWYFGNNNIAVEFARPLNIPELITDHKLPPFNVIGNATANKPETGDLLFYTDGFNVYDGSYVVMSGISAVDKLDADINKNQSVAITSAPGNNDLYYIFTNTPSGAIHLSQVDMTSNGNAIMLQPPLGRVLSPLNQTITNSTANASDGMIIVPNDTNTGYWLITLDQGTNTYKVLGIDSTTPGTWLENTYALGATMDAAHIAFNPDSLKIAVAPKSQNINIQILDIDLATGTLSFDREILNSGNADFATEAVFDVAWSQDGSKLYYSRYGDQAGSLGNLMQVDMSLPPSASPVSVLPATVFGSYGLQLGPDGNMYHLYQNTNGGPFLIGRVIDADSIPSLVTYEPAIENGQNFNSFQFPAFLPPRDPQLSVDFSFAGTCANSPTAFFPQITPAPTSVQWDFGDGNTSSDLAPIITYTAANTYNVTLTAILNGQPMQASKPVTITDFQAQLTLPADTVACQCELPKYGPTCTAFSVTVQVQNDPGNLTYTWSTGETGMTLHPDSAGYYYVVATDGICSTYAGVYVQEYDTTIPGIATDQRSNVWYFGQNAGIDFNTTPATALTDGAMDAMEGCTAVSDRNGQVIFYTDGDILFDRTHTQIDSGLGGTPNATGPAAQSVIAVPNPNDETLFYIFTTQSTDPSSPDYEFNYSLFDLKQNNGLGGVIEKNVTLFTKSTERVAATPNWVVMHEYGNNNFRAYPISPNGIGSPVISSIGEDYSTVTADNGKGYMKFSQGATKLAVAVVENDGVNPPNNYLDLFDFDNTTGTVTDFGRADLDADGANGTAYGVDFSPGGNKVYVTVKNNGGGSQIMEYRANYVDSMHVYSPIMTDGGELGAIQLGPDGQMYVAVNGVSTLGIINPQEDTLQTSTYNASGFALAGRNSHLGLPNFVQQTGTAGFSPGISVSSPVCIGQPVFLSANVTSSIDEAEWQITDPSGAIVFTSTQLADTLTLSSSGDHVVSLLLKNRCLDPINTYSEIITVNPPPQNSDLPVATFLCGTTTTLPVYSSPPANIADLDFAWSTGETTPSIDVTTTGNFNVIITDRTSGCTNSADVFVGPPIPIDLGPDNTICESDPLTLDSQVNADTYVWSVNSVPQPGTRYFDFGALALSGGTYTVQVDATIDLGGSVGPCTVTDQTIITVNPSPSFTGVETVQANCGAIDGVISVDVASTGSFSYTVASESGTIVGPAAGFIINNIPPGVNALTLTNDVTGCSQVENVTVTSPTSFSISAATPNDETCATGDGSIDYSVAGTVGSFTATVRDLNNVGVTFTGTGTGAGNFTVSNIPAGDYSLEIQEDAAPNCIEIWIGNPPTSPPVAQALTIGSPANSDLQVANNPVLACGTSADLSTSVTSLDVTPEWSLDGINFNPVTMPFTTLGSSTVTVRAPATATPTCEVTQQIEVVVTPTPTVSITRDDSDICNGNVTLTAVGDGGYGAAQIGYRWSTGETTTSITVNQSGNYTVNAYHTIHQSCLTPASESVTIPTPFTVTISSTLACDDGQPFTLTATPNGQTNNNLTFTWFLNAQELGQVNSSIVGLDEGLYEVVAEDQSGCTATAQLTINRIPLTPTNLSSAPVFCPDDGSLILDAGPNFISYVWSDGSINQTLEVFNGGIYSVNATNNFGCVTIDQSEVIEDCIPKINGPNAFRPGGLNTTYSLFTEYIDTFEIFIFDQWGEMVYHSENKDFAWDGIYNGELLPAGQYSWVVRYTSSFRDRGTIEKYGGVTLLR